MTSAVTGARRNTSSLTAAAIAFTTAPNVHRLIGETAFAQRAGDDALAKVGTLDDFGEVVAVRIAFRPGIAAAAAVSIRTTLAWGIVLRSSLANSMPSAR